MESVKVRFDSLGRKIHPNSVRAGEKNMLDGRIAYVCAHMHDLVKCNVGTANGQQFLLEKVRVLKCRLLTEVQNEYNRACKSNQRD